MCEEGSSGKSDFCGVCRAGGVRALVSDLFVGWFCRHLEKTEKYRLGEMFVIVVRWR